MKKKTAIKIVLFIVLAAGGFLAAAFTFNFFAGEPIPPGTTTLDGLEKPPERFREARAQVRDVREWHEAVGTVRPRTEARIESQVMARVMDIKVNPGNRVEKGELLAVLDNREFTSRLDQAREGLKSAVAARNQARETEAAARAAFAQAEADYRRTRTYFESEAATEQQLEQARSAFLQAEASVKRAKEGLAGADAGIEQAREIVKEAEIALGYTRLEAPAAGEILERLAEPGDLALPGKPLLVIQTVGGLRLEAYVREGLIQKATPGDAFPATISAIDKQVEAVVEEIVPYADPQTRTFLVKAALPDIPGLYPGMYGKLMIPVAEHPAVLVPADAVRKVGQLELVDVKTEAGIETRFVKTGKRIDDKVEVFSGLSGDETIVIEEHE